MDLDFTKEQKLIRDSAREFLQAECPKDLVRELEESEKGYSPELWQKIAELGWIGLNIPEEYDGMGMDFLDLVIVLEEIGYNLLPGPFFSTVMGAFPIIYGGTEEQKSVYLPEISEGKLKLALAVTEPAATYDPLGILIEALPEGDDFVINGTKLFVENANIADFLICAVRTKQEGRPEDGISLFIIDSKSPGISVSVVPTIGLDMQCEVNFVNVKVPKTNILGGPNEGWGILKRTLEMAAIGKCAEMLGGMKACMEMTNAYLKRRIAYGRPIALFQVVQHYLADVWVKSETAGNITYEAAWMISEGLPAAVKASVAKAWVGKGFAYVSERCVQMHGAIGMTREQDIGLYYRRAKAWDLAFGDEQHHRELLVRELGF